PRQGTEQEEHAGCEQGREESGPPPVQPFALIECGEEHCKPCARIEKTGEARRFGRFLGRRCGWYAEVDAKHHEWREHYGVPEHPFPRKMFPVPPEKGGSNIDGAIDEGRIKCDREGKVAKRNVSQRKG